MNNIIKEVITRKEKPLWQIMLIILGSVVFVNTLITLSNHLGRKYAGIVSLIILFSSILITGFVLMRVFSVYSYKLVDNKLIFERVLGNKEKVLLSINIEEIETLKPYNEIDSSSKIDCIYKFVLDKEYDKFFVGEFQRDGKTYRFVFKPSERLLRIIDKKISEKAV
ncbi:hypothetical protein [Caldisalinibacter kiritimatiensis]|uniref:Uncharacterized protein n=1 Tax=Caldisalinibacter kiritimatiensis TaxID=1304284 RepID=R1CQL0_9FIRM|nr:hypothetical protein [Caldisalinibacter kiritimatiensis]EOD00951.1 hypothetical protein L21TH_0988 [Caldisalinibacter kiritimatiensis]